MISDETDPGNRPVGHKSHSDRVRILHGVLECLPLVDTLAHARGIVYTPILGPESFESHEDHHREERKADVLIDCHICRSEPDDKHRLRIRLSGSLNFHMAEYAEFFSVFHLQYSVDVLSMELHFE